MPFRCEMKVKKTRTCPSCDKTFKNSSSLATHKHRYHPNSPKKHIEKDDVLSLNSDHSEVSSFKDNNIANNIEICIDDNKRAIESLDWAFSDIKKLLDELDSKIRLKSLNIQKGDALSMSPTNSSKILNDIQTIKFQSDANRRLIESLKNQIKTIIHRFLFNDEQTDDEENQSVEESESEGEEGEETDNDTTEDEESEDEKSERGQFNNYGYQ